MSANEMALPIEHPHFLARVAIYRDQCAGLISPAEAQRQSALVGQSPQRQGNEPHQRALALWPGKRSIFMPRRPQRARLHPERIDRRRGLAIAGHIPAHLGRPFTTSQLAVLAIVADEVRRKGACDRSLDEIAARAGVCRTTAQTAFRVAEGAGLLSIEVRPRKGQKNLPNLVRIVSTEWVDWIARKPRAIGSNKLGRTDTTILDISLPTKSWGLPPQKEALEGRKRPVGPSCISP